MPLFSFFQKWRAARVAKKANAIPDFTSQAGYLAWKAKQTGRPIERERKTIVLPPKRKP